MLKSRRPKRPKPPLTKQARFSPLGVLSVAGLAIVFGIIVIVATRAASPAISVEPELGGLSGASQVVGDASASGGQAVRFGASLAALPSPGTWTNVTNNLANMPSECGNLTLISQVPGVDKTIAGVARVGLFMTTNGGSNWLALGTGSGSEFLNNRPSSIVYDPANANIFWVSGIYGDGVFKTTDGGLTFHRLGNISHVDSVSIDFTDPNRQTLLAGGHEASKTVYKSSDGGQTWTNIGGNLAGTGFSSSPLVMNAQTYIVNSYPSWGGGTAGIFRTTNGGSSWQQVSTLGPAKLPKIAPDGTIYWNLPGTGLAKSIDSGQTWSAVGQSAGLQNERDLVILADGRIAAQGGNGIMVSADKGITWTQSGANFTTAEEGISYSPSRNAFFAWAWDCGNAVLPNAIMKLQ
jgi:hypothetical protein